MAQTESAPVDQPQVQSPELELADVIEGARAGSQTGFLPPRPRTLADTGLTSTFVADMILKMLHFSTQLPAYEIATRLRLDYECIHQVMAQLANNSLIQSLGQAPKAARHLESLEEGMAFMITEGGRERAREILDRNQYMGPAPVPLHEYNNAVRRQSLPENFATHDGLRKALGELVVAEETLELLGPAFNSRSSVFLYGHPGNGKSSIARAAQTLLGGGVYMPYALVVDDAVVRLYDPSHHEPLGEAVSEADQRWVRCRRPFVQVGGELDLSMLDLTWHDSFKFYEAGLQMKANCGIFLVDDFGRQDVSPRKLLNRFIVPLEEGTDYLNMANVGKKIEVPFGMMIFFSTNLEPSELVDEAFLRRIRYKINIPDPNSEEFKEIFVREAEKLGLSGGDASAYYVLGKYYKSRSPRGVHPRDILAHVREIAAYLGQPPSLSKELLDRACSTYFLLEKV
ncbi:MAG TPA: ATP-binding protein [Candidatus Dormibacteraeota bacterium]|jgi:predicted ATPase with chaperone activity|nr:ATP-binding protein [Candidatus Dormibacteraeota bacterium]